MNNELKGVLEDNSFNVIVQITESGPKGDQGPKGDKGDKGDPGEVTQAEFDALKDDFDSHLNDYATYKDSNSLKVAKVEKELNDYQQTMASVNVNQEAKQTASGYGIVSLPKNAANGQVSGVVRGLTATNLVENGDFRDGLKGWVIKWASNDQYYFDSENSAFYINTKYNNVGVTNTVGVPIVGHKYYFKMMGKQVNGIGQIVSVGWGADSNDIYNPNRFEFTPSDYNTDTFSIMSKVFTVTEIGDNQSDKILISGYLGGECDLLFKDVILVDLTETFGAENEPTVEQCDRIFANYFDSTKSTVSAMRLKSVSEDESEASMVYVTAKDSEDKIAELRSLPNGIKDEINVTQGKFIKRVSDDVVIDGNLPWALENTNEYRTTLVMSVVETYLPNMANDGSIIGRNSEMQFSSHLPVEAVGRVVCTNNYLYIALPVPNSTLEDAKNYLNTKPVTLIYQLAEPIEIPVQVSGSIISYPSGTIYIEPFVADAGVYTDKIEVLHDDLPIKAIEKVSKVDFMTGIETELDISQAEISEDKLSFTHPDLSEGDIVFFEYEYDVESTEGEAEVEYYDSRYTIKDSVTDKFYKWNVTVADGVPSIELVEV